MRPLMLSLLLLSTGCCATDRTVTKAPVAPTVRALDTAETRTSPAGTGQVQHLAQGRQAFVARLELAPHAKIPEHRDESEEYIHILSGQGLLWIDGERHEVTPGTTVFMPSNARVSFENGAEKLVALQVFASPKSALKYQSWPAKSP